MGEESITSISPNIEWSEGYLQSSFSCLSFQIQPGRSKSPPSRIPGACPGIRKRGGPKSESLFFFFFFFCFSIFQGGGGPAQKLGEKMTFSPKNVAKYRWNSLIFVLMTFFFFFLLFNF